MCLINNLFAFYVTILLIKMLFLCVWYVNLTCITITWHMHAHTHIHTHTYIYTQPTLIKLTSFIPMSKWKILAWTMSVHQVIYDQLGGWFCPTPGEQNNLKLVNNTPDLHQLWVLKFHSINDLPFVWMCVSFSAVFLPFLTRLSSIIARCNRSLYMHWWFFTDSS